MSLKLKWFVLGGVTLLVAVAVIVVAWRREAGLMVRAVSAVSDTPSPTDPRPAHYVRADTVPLTPDSKAAAAAKPSAAHHIVNLLPDSAYPSFATQLTNVNASGEVRAVIYADLLRRPNTSKLPWLLAMARSPGVGQAGEAAAWLRAPLREEHGADWDAGSERISLWLQAPPPNQGRMSATKNVYPAPAPWLLCARKF